MSERRNRGGWQIAAAIAAVVLILLPSLYLLSEGPAYWLGQYGYVDKDTFDFIYHPLAYLMLEFSWFGDAVRWYDDFCFDHLPALPAP